MIDKSKLLDAGTTPQDTDTYILIRAVNGKNKFHEITHAEAKTSFSKQSRIFVVSEMDIFDKQSVKGLMNNATFNFFEGLTANDFVFETAADSANPTYTNHGTGASGQSVCETVLRGKTALQSTLIKLTCITGKSGQVELAF